MSTIYVSILDQLASYYKLETDEQLAERRINSDRYKREAEQKLRREESRLAEELDALEDARNLLSQLQQERGGLEAEKRVSYLESHPHILRFVSSSTNYFTIFRKMNMISKKEIKRFNVSHNNSVLRALGSRLSKEISWCRLNLN